MRVYLFTPLVASPELNANYRRIVDTLKASGVFVVASADEHNTDFKREELERMQEAGEILLDKMDCIIIEASKPDQEIGYLLAYAISQKKPVLYLFQRGASEGVAHGYLTKKNTPEFIKIVQYTSAALEEKLLEFLNECSTGTIIKEKPNIKFTLRITPHMERYLEWKSKKLKKKKADFLREIVEKIIEGDGEFNPTRKS